MTSSHDAAALRDLLRRVDGSAPSIQQTASAMMKHYDRMTITVAVNEWRNALLQTSTTDPYLPLLYVINEVVQNSKRNRGNKFLEVLGPVLGPSLRHMCQTDPNLTEKVRRVVKIWGERHVFSIRYVNELMQLIEPYRFGRHQQQQQQQDDDDMLEHDGARFSPIATPQQQQQQQEASTTDHSLRKTDSKAKGTQVDTDDDILEIMQGSGGHDSKNVSGDGEDTDSNDDDGDNDDVDDDDDDDDALFGSGANDDEEGPRLRVEINLDTATAAAANTDSAVTTTSTTARLKRRRSSATSGTNNGHSTTTTPAVAVTAGTTAGTNMKKRRKSNQMVLLSASKLMELWNRIDNVQQRYDHATRILNKLDERLASQTATSALLDLVGDELQQAAKQNEKDRLDMLTQRRSLHAIAIERHDMEREAVRYLPWLEKALQQDDDDIEFSNQLEQKILSFGKIHGAIQRARDRRVEQQQRIQRQQEERERKLREQAETERFRRAALAKQTEARPGMVWNKATGEYQDLDTEETWRD